MAKLTKEERAGILEQAKENAGIHTSFCDECKADVDTWVNVLGETFCLACGSEIN